MPHLLAILISYNRTLCHSGISTQHDVVLEWTSDDGCAGASSFGEWNSFLRKKRVPGRSYTSWQVNKKYLAVFEKSKPEDEKTEAMVIVQGRDA